MENSQKKKSGMIRRLSLLIGVPSCLIVLILLVVAALSSHDQIRPLTVSDNPLEPILKREVITRIKELARQPDKKEAKATLLEIAQKSFPWPNTAKWPAGHQEEARRYKAEMSEVLVNNLTLIERTRGLAFKDAYKQHLAWAESMRAINKKYKDMLHRLSSKEQWEMSERINDLFNATHTGLHVDRGQWIDAAESSLNDWDKATYYLRRGGFKGRGLLAIWSFMRRMHLGFFR